MAITESSLAFSARKVAFKARGMLMTHELRQTSFVGDGPL